jgi:hypothetical protein
MHFLGKKRHLLSLKRRGCEAMEFKIPFFSQPLFVLYGGQGKKYKKI